MKNISTIMHSQCKRMGGGETELTRKFSEFLKHLKHSKFSKFFSCADNPEHLESDYSLKGGIING